MKHNILSIIGVGFLIMTAWSCREQSDTLMTYDHDDRLVFGSAETSFAAKFNVMWNGMNQYYSIWDYEAEQGIEWDAIYEEFYPQFEALDQRSATETVTDDELNELLKKFLGPLHDGHLAMTVKNHKTGSSVMYCPGDDKIKQRDDYQTSTAFSPDLSYYANVANGEVETDADGTPIVKEYSTSAYDLLNVFINTPGKGKMWVDNKIRELEALSSPTQMQKFQLQEYKELKEDFNKVYEKPISDAVTIYNSLQAKYSILEIPGFDYIDPAFAGEKDIRVKFVLLKNNIAYFHLSRFWLSNYLNDEMSNSYFDMSIPATQQHVANIRNVWQGWFDNIQTLHKNGTLGGVIIDLRNNGGGSTGDSQYVVGSLTSAEKIHYGYERFKRGSARYDYSPLLQAFASTMKQPHENITEPIIILTNCQSVSMSECSTLCVKTLSNGKVIGKRTFGALCSVLGNKSNEDFFYNYTGYIGIENVTPVFGYVPIDATFTLDKKLIEGHGITPDIEVDLDLTQFQATGKDSQLDRALQFIRTGR